MYRRTAEGFENNSFDSSPENLKAGNPHNIMPDSEDECDQLPDESETNQNERSNRRLGDESTHQDSMDQDRARRRRKKKHHHHHHHHGNRHHSPEKSSDIVPGQQQTSNQIEMQSKPQLGAFDGNGDLEGTSTFMKDNPLYEAFSPPSQNYPRDSPSHVNLGRQDSTKRLLSRSSVVSGESQIPALSGPLTSKIVTMAECSEQQQNDGHLNEGSKIIPFMREDTFLSVLSQPFDGDFTTVTQQQGIAEYVKNNISMRECCKYIRNASADDQRCCCGREFGWHEEMDLLTSDTGSNIAWKVDQHTKTLPTDCFGTICFQGFGQEASKNAPYIRIDQKTSPETMWTLLDKHWKVPKPKLIISVTGGAKRFFLKNRLRDNFKRGLVNVATTTSAWIITGGTNAGVMEFVGEAVRDHMLTVGGSEQKVVALGIATWGIVDNKENLVPEYDSDQPGCFPAPYNVKDLSPKTVRGVSPLDCNHTHFILVDNGQEKKFGGEISFRAAFSNYIAHIETEVARNQRVTVPVVLLVLEGGENTIKTAMEALENNTPVVIIQGSGRAADVIAFAYKYFKNKGTEDQLVFAPDTIDGTPPNPKAFADIQQKVEDWLDWTREKKDPQLKRKKIFGCVKNIQQMLKKKHLITVFYLDDIDTTNEIDQAILYALLKAKKSQFLQQLNLAVAWNRCDIARQEIFKNENRQEWQSRMEDLYEAMFTALIQNRIDFVQLFLDNGVELKEFLTVRRLRELYDEVVNDRRAGNSANLLRHLLQQTQNTWQVCSCCNKDQWQGDLPDLLKLVGVLVNNLAGDQYQNLYRGDQFIVPDEPAPRTTMSYDYPDHGTYSQKMDSTQGNSTTRSFTKRKSQFQTQVNPIENPEEDLLFWAVLFNRKDLALLFWRLGQDHIAGALTASSILKALAEKAGEEEEIDLSNELQANADEFEEMAIGVLNECHERDKQMAHKLLVRSNSIWGKSSVFSIADNSEHMAFMGHSSCQTKLNIIWKGKMALYTSMLKIIFGLIFFPFVVPTIRFTNASIEQSNQVQPTDTAPQGIHSSGKKKRISPKLYTVDACGCCEGKTTVHYFKAIYFYHTAPLVKFCYHTLSYLVFLALFCFFLLTDMRHTEDGGPSVYEYIVWGWAATMFFEEIRQILTRTPPTIRYKLASYFGNVWNRFDITVYFLLVLCIVLRYSLSFTYFVWARNFYAITLVLFFLRFMHTFYVEKNMGPKVIMIRKMMTDLTFFVMILSVFVFGYGVASLALRQPNSPPSWNLLKDVVYMPYWQLYGELFLEDLDDGTCPNGQTCEESWLVVLLLAIYMILTNVLLLNLLIAMFSYTFERVQENSEKVWRFYRFGLIYEYFEKPTLAPPLIILSHLFRVIKYIRRRCAKKGMKDTDFYKKLSREENKKMTAFERAGMENFLLRRHMLSREHIDMKVAATGDRIEKVIEDLEQIKETVIQADDGTSQVLMPVTDTPDALTTTRSTVEHRENIGVLQSRISGLQDQLEEQHHQMKEMFSLMTSLAESLPTPGPQQTTVMTVRAAPGAPIAPPSRSWDISPPQDLPVPSVHPLIEPRQQPSLSHSPQRSDPYSRDPYPRDPHTSERRSRDRPRTSAPSRRHRPAPEPEDSFSDIQHHRSRTRSPPPEETAQRHEVGFGVLYKRRDTTGSMPQVEIQDYPPGDSNT